MKDLTFEVERIRFLNRRIFELRLRPLEALPPLHCGQFIHLKAEGGLPLRRPFCLYKFDKRSVTLAIAITGKGTEGLSRLGRGCRVQGIAPLGNGFALGEEVGRVALVGGGMGCAPLLAVPQCFPKPQYRAYLGFASAADAVFEKEFRRRVPTFVSTDDGGRGFRGYVHQLWESGIADFCPDAVLACGPVPMLRAVAQVCAQRGIPAFASLEERMGCGIGACLACVCAVRAADGSPHNLRVCADGPVFNLGRVVF